MPKVPATLVAASLQQVLRPLLLCNFFIGTGVMVLPGKLNDIRSSLAISVAVAGQLITVAAAVMCIGAPLFASVAAGWAGAVHSHLWHCLAKSVRCGRGGSCPTASGHLRSPGWRGVRHCGPKRCCFAWLSRSTELVRHEP